MSKKPNRIELTELLGDFWEALAEPPTPEVEPTPEPVGEETSAGEEPTPGGKPKRRADLIDRILPTTPTTSRFTVDLALAEQKILNRAAKATGKTKATLVRGLITVLGDALNKRQ